MLVERHLRRAIWNYVEHYHVERCHQGLGNRPIGGVPKSPAGCGSAARATGRDPKPLLQDGRMSTHSNLEQDTIAQRPIHQGHVPQNVR